jgi:hypothetical protein
LLHSAQMTLSITVLYHCDECRYAERCILFIAMLSVTIMNVVILTVIAPLKWALLNPKVSEDPNKLWQSSQLRLLGNGCLLVWVCEYFWKT